jgi:hypothetical protein
VVAAGGFEYLIHHRALNNANHEVAELRVEFIDKLKGEAKKKLPKGEKADDAALTKAAAARLESDAKVKADFDKKVEETHHHAEGGLFPLACFFGIASGLLGALFGSILLVKRNKDAGVWPWAAIFSHVPSFAFYALIGFLPVIGHLAHHEHMGIIEFLKQSVPVRIGATLALLGAFVNLALCLLPGGKCCCDDDHGHHHGDDHGHGDEHDHNHEHGETCCGSH